MQNKSKLTRRHELLRPISDQTFTVGQPLALAGPANLCLNLCFTMPRAPCKTVRLVHFNLFCKSAIANLRPHSLFLGPNGMPCAPPMRFPRCMRRNEIPTTENTWRMKMTPRRERTMSPNGNNASPTDNNTSPTDRNETARQTISQPI